MAPSNTPCTRTSLVDCCKFFQHAISLNFFQQTQTFEVRTVHSIVRSRCFPNFRDAYFIESLYSSRIPPDLMASSSKSTPSIEDGQPTAHATTPYPKTEVQLSGRIVCNSCDSVIPIQNSTTGKFTASEWETHRLEWYVRFFHVRRYSHFRISQSASPANPQTDETELYKSTVFPTFAINQGETFIRRRRAKRTEQERINYLASDPYVSKFEVTRIWISLLHLLTPSEPYRVECAICNKWIRLRPNSTYCSIPWDAHRKSCLARRG